MVNQKQSTLTIQALAEAVGDLLARRDLTGQRDRRVAAVPDVRTIRYYTTLGLLAPPQIEGRQARYRRLHVLQLAAIKLLQGASLSLAEIQGRLYGRTEQELEALLAAVAAPVPHIRPVLWRELVLEPGVKLLVEDQWQPDKELAPLLKRIEMALAALKNIPNGKNGGSKP